MVTTLGMARRTEKSTPKAAPASTKTVSAWLDDPESGAGRVDRPVPDLSKGSLKFRIKGTAPAAGSYAPGTPQFRYWTAAEALRRGGDFWAPILGLASWQPGKSLAVSLDKGVDLNAYYDRTELAFFHEAVKGKTYYSGESPDVICHEMGHACLDAHRPQLWDAPFIEAGSFHESFGDMSAILTAIQLPQMRAKVIASVAAYKANELSRCAEELGHAIRLVAPDAVDKDCLRNAYNKFKYVDPQTLPDDAPATALCAEVHSFSRIFTGAFYEILAGMLHAKSKKPKDADFVAVAKDLAALLSDGTAAAPVQPDYYAQVAAHMIDADATRFQGRYRDILTEVFVDRHIVPASAVHPLQAAQRKAVKAVTMAAAAARREPQSRRVAIPAAQFGLGDKTIIVVAPVERNPFLTAAAGLAHRNEPPIEDAAHRFVKMLFAHGRVDVESGKKKLGVTAQTPREHLRKTHVLTPAADGLRLSRRLFHCGCALPCGHYNGRHGFPEET
jgi:hypothetical protein